MVNEVEGDFTNKELYDAIKALQDSHAQMVVLSPEEIKYIKEMIEDRKAIGRWANKAKLILGLIIGILTVWALFPFEYLGLGK